MRVIEFRGKAIDGDTWYHGDLEYNRVDNIARIHIYDKDGYYIRQHYINPNTIGQFTGLFDKNGTKIYEGDICRMECGKRFVYLQVGWHENDAHFGFRIKGENHIGCSEAFSDWIRQRRVEVIGNIHDNPELMKGGKE